MLTPTKPPETRTLILSNDPETPWDVVVGLLRTVFAMTPETAEAVTRKVDKEGQACLGPYPANVAEAFLAAAIEARGLHPLNIRIMADEDDGPRCAFCERLTPEGQRRYTRGKATICQDCLAAGYAQFRSDGGERPDFGYAFQALGWHFAGIPKNLITSTARGFPGHMRADVQTAVSSCFSRPDSIIYGVLEEYRYETLTFAKLMSQSRSPSMIAQAEYEDLDIGSGEPVKCLRNGFWLLHDNDMPYVVVLSEHREFDRELQVRIEIAAPIGEQGRALTARCFKFLEDEVEAARSYRGKVLSFEAKGRYRGQSGGMMVHRLPPVSREDVILPQDTLALLDRNLLDFVENREKLRALGQPTRKGILLYGPPGTGKTHTIRYLAHNLPGHTTLLITAQQVAKLDQYVLLARLLQPAMVVIEDVDLIARQRENMNGPCEESMLNELLNEMDGLKGDADIIFVLTTNRPEQLEEALAGRPGRVDQAIEIPLPDEACRKRLILLYGGNLALGDPVVAEAAARTHGMSAAFIKEMMRRIAQLTLGRDGGTVSSADMAHAIDDMLFSGGRLNARLLGAETT
ncbi:ATP-dependent Clp protease adaptor ClpS [Aestuariivirga sp.]|uniref:ATP-dependent Clp protease adaptor ClpS n=1 Tax=Aestuariivirga sp. TaxID=2650926 RepID=UPI0025BB032E|nr:ATP-dependent Clp protease adaptor ClpS [Aestuariivirga sp.]